MVSILDSIHCLSFQFIKNGSAAIGNKCNREKGHGIIYPNDVIKKLIYNIKNLKILLRAYILIIKWITRSLNMVVNN